MDVALISPVLTEPELVIFFEVIVSLVISVFSNFDIFAVEETILFVVIESPT